MNPPFKKQETWQAITSHFSASLQPDDFETWFSPARLKALDGEVAVIEVPNRFFAEWIKERYLPDLRSAFERFASVSPEIRFTFRQGRLENGAEPPLNTVGIPSYSLPNLNPDWTFNQFICSDSNSFAFYSCIEIVDRNPKSYSPLYLFSDRSTGKTHLLHAIGNRALERHPDWKVRYIHADRFTSEFTKALRADQVHPFRTLYADLDLLLFDDVHLLAGRSKTQQEFTFVFNALLREGRTVVITSSSAPFRLSDLNPRLRSILSWGLLAEIHPPETETRIEVLRRLSAIEEIPLPDDIIFFLAKSNDDMKHLLRNMTRLQTYVSLNGGAVKLNAVRNLIRAPGQRDTEMDEIMAITSGYFKLSIADLTSDNRRRAITYPRQMAMYLCKKHTSQSYKAIGKAFSKKDHSTVLYAVRRIDQKRVHEERVREDLENLENLIG